MKAFAKLTSNLAPPGVAFPRHESSLTVLETFKPFISRKDNPRGDSPSLKSLISHHLRNHEIYEARRVFAGIPSPDPHLCTMMITAFFRTNRPGEAFNLFNKMTDRDLPSWNSMIKGCLDCGDLNSARKMFDEMPKRNVISWTTMVSGLAQFGRIDAAENLFHRMPHRDIAAWNSMISAYCRSGRVSDASMMFERMPQRDVISWTAMIGGYVQNGEGDKALFLFKQMWGLGIQPTSSTFACIVTACANTSYLSLGIQLHAHLQKEGIP